MISERELEHRLSPYLPSGTADTIARWIVKSGVHFRITMPRNSVYGDYQHPYAGKGHRITVNGNLNAFSFLVTTVHEFAHLECWLKHGNWVKPHGDEWKREYKNLMRPFLERHVFPDDIEKALRKYMADPGASSCSDGDLMRTLKRYDRIRQILLEEISEGVAFRLSDRDFIRGKKLRTRYECKEIGTGHVYLINGTAEIVLLEP